MLMFNVAQKILSLQNILINAQVNRRIYKLFTNLSTKIV